MPMLHSRSGYIQHYTFLQHFTQITILIGTRLRLTGIPAHPGLLAMLMQLLYSLYYTYILYSYIIQY